MTGKRDREGIGLPPRTFFYTPDQLATLLEVDLKYLKEKLLHYEGRSPGICPRSQMSAVNIAPEGEPPIWRISENHFLRYLRAKGVKFYDRGYIL